MPKVKFNKAKISAIYTVVPPICKSIDDEVENYGGDLAQIERIKTTIGLNKRYVTDEKTTTLDLCEKASNYLLEETKFDKSKINALIFVTQTPDHFQPSNAAITHGRLDLSKDCASFDVNLGCSGFVYGLWLSYMMIETGSCENVLLLAGDTMSKCVNPKDRATAPLFGDAGTATLIQKSEIDNPSYFSLHTNGKGFSNIIIPSGAFRNRPDDNSKIEITDESGNTRNQENLFMNGSEIFNFSIKEEPVAINEILEFSGKTKDDIDYIIFHQANKYIISNITRRLKFPLEKSPCGTVEKFGNQSSASIPATICDSISDEIKNGSKTVIFSGFGVGLSWASCLLNLSNVSSDKIKILY